MNTYEENFPYFLNKIRPVGYYQYKSSVNDMFYSIDYNTVGVKDAFFGKNKNTLDVYNWFQKIFDIIVKKNKDIHISTNKVVFRCLTESLNTVYIGWYDGRISAGLGRRGDDWVKEIKIKYNKIIK